VLDAGGIYLEGIGAKFGVARGGMTDEVYRAAIIVEARSLFASGDSAAVLGLMRALLPPEAVLHETEFYPHCFVVFVQEASLEILDILAQLMEDVPALTVNGAFGWIDDEVLSYGDVDGDPDVVISAGFGDVDGDIVDGVAGLAAVIPI
jgi:hypothetical protein